MTLQQGGAPQYPFPLSFLYLEGAPPSYGGPLRGVEETLFFFYSRRRGVVDPRIGNGIGIVTGIGIDPSPGRLHVLPYLLAGKGVPLGAPLFLYQYRNVRAGAPLPLPPQQGGTSFPLIP